MSKKNTQYKIDQGFFPAYVKVFQCGEVCTIVDHVEKSIPWDIYSSVVYSFILNRFMYFRSVQMTQEYIASNCNCSIDVVKKRIKQLEELKIVVIERGKVFSGLYKSNKYTSVIDITKDTKYKLKPSKVKKRYEKTLKDRRKRLSLLKGIVISNKWTKDQIRNYISNKNYELITGIYLEGDKLNEKLYIKERLVKGNYQPEHNTLEGFSLSDELKEYELKELEDTLIREDE